MSFEAAVGRSAAMLSRFGAVLFAGGLLGCLLAGFLGSVLAAALLAAAAWVGDWLIGRSGTGVVRAWGRSGLDATVRSALRVAALLIAVIAAHRDGDDWVAVSVAAVLVLAQSSRAFYAGSMELARARAAMRPRWRNLQVDGRRSGPPAFREPLVRVRVKSGARLLRFSDAPVLIGVVVAGAGWPPAAVAGALVSIAICLLADLAAALLLRRSGSPARAAQVRGQVQAAVRALAPTVVLYDASAASSPGFGAVLELLADAGVPALVIVREPALFSAAKGTAPVILVPREGDARDFVAPSMRAVFYGSHSPRNRQLSRFPAMRHCFVGPMGPGDAPPSPLARVYDEVWVPTEAELTAYLKLNEGLSAGQVRVLGAPGTDWAAEIAAAAARAERARKDRKRRIAKFQAALA